MPETPPNTAAPETPGNAPASLEGARVLFVAYYYLPYVSGLTVHVAQLAQGLVRAGASVVVLAGRHDPGLAEREILDGVRVRRLRAVARVDKGIVLPGLVPIAARLARQADIVIPVLPLAEAGPLSLMVPRQKLLPLYICDLRLGQGVVARGIEMASHAASRLAVRRAPGLCASSREYVDASRVVGGVAGTVVETPPPVPVEGFVRTPSDRLRREIGLAPGPTIGFVGRLVREKGLPVLIEALGLVRREIPDVNLVIAGEGRAVAGGGLGDEVAALVEGDERVVLTGFLPDDRLAELYSMLDVLALPSVDPLEAYGIVQVEAMLCGCPVVASDMPGVRIPVSRTGMGLLAAPGDAEALAAALVRAIRGREGFLRPREDVVSALGPDIPVAALSQEITRRQGGAAALAATKTTWDRLGADDPLWAVLTEPDKQGNRWAVDDFMRTGRDEIAQVLGTLADLGTEPPHGAALDFGCGVGRLSQALAGHFDRVQGVDIADSMVERARSLNVHGDRVTYTVNDTPRIAFLDDGAFDLVYTSRVLQHIPPAATLAYLGEFVRVLRPGGVVVLQVPDRPSDTLTGRVMSVLPEPVTRRVRRAVLRTEGAMEMHAIPRDEVTRVLEEAGAEVVDVSPDSAAGPHWVSYRYIARKR